MHAVLFISLGLDYGVMSASGATKEVFLFMLELHLGLYNEKYY